MIHKKISRKRERESTVRQAVSTVRGNVRPAVLLFAAGETRRDDGRCIFFWRASFSQFKLLNSHLELKANPGQVGIVRRYECGQFDENSQTIDLGILAGSYS